MKTFYLAILIFIIPGVLISQNVKYGLLMGVTSASWRGDTDQFAQDFSNEVNDEEGYEGFDFSNKSRIGFSLGFFVDCQVKNEFSIQPALNYTQKGTKLIGDGSVTVIDGFDKFTFQVEEDVTMRLNYLDLLVLAKYNLTKGKLKPYLVFGPGVSFLVASKMKDKVTIEGESDTNTLDYDDTFNKFDANLTVGGGIDFHKRVRLEVSYQWGFISVLEYDSNDGFELYNGVLAFNVMVVF